MKCPYCGLLMECDTVDIGVGFAQCGPYYCDGCGASEIGPEGVTGAVTPMRPRRASTRTATAPTRTHTVGGNLCVSHQVAKAAYRLGRLDPKPSDP